MKVKSISDKDFRKYGKVVEGIDADSILKILDKLSCPEGVDYIASCRQLERLLVCGQIQEHCFGGLKIEAGYCVGHNDKLNALEYHRSSEINVAGTDIILLLGKQSDISEDYTYETSKVEAFFVPAGTVVELYATTLHFAPCGVKENGYAFKTACILPYGTNFDKPRGQAPINKEEELYFARNKWLIAHPDGGQEGAYIGLTGENISVADGVELPKPSADRDGAK